MYGKLVNGTIQYAPMNLVTEDNIVIPNFYLDEELMLQYGYKPVFSEIPEYDAEKQYVVLQAYVETDIDITAQYVIIDKEVPPEPLEIRVARIEQQLAKQQKIFEKVANNRQ